MTYEFDRSRCDDTDAFYAAMRREFYEIIMRKWLRVREDEVTPRLLELCEEHKVKLVPPSERRQCLSMD